MTELSAVLGGRKVVRQVKPTGAKKMSRSIYYNVKIKLNVSRCYIILFYVKNQYFYNYQNQDKFENFKLFCFCEKNHNMLGII